MMKKTISVEQFCGYYKIPSSFINNLVEYELIEVVIVDDRVHLEEENLAKVEQLIRLHYDLNLNFEALDVVSNLLSRIDEMNREISFLRNRINCYSRE